MNIVLHQLKMTQTRQCGLIVRFFNDVTGILPQSFLMAQELFKRGHFNRS